MHKEKNILIAFFLNLGFAIFEFFGGLFTCSIAILSDAIHDLGDAISIGLAYFLEKKSRCKPDYKYTYGYIRYSLLGSIITTIILLTGSIFVIKEAIGRVLNPVALHYDGMIIIAVFGFVINLIATYFTKDGDSLNQKAVNLHMLEDVLGWFVVLIGSIIIKFTNFYIIDSLLSILVALFIFYNAWHNLQEIIDIFLEKTPKDVDLKTMEKNISKLPNVINVHHIHVRSIDGENNYATMHVVLKKYSKKTKDEIKKVLIAQNIVHSTIELELENEHCENYDCYLKPRENHHHH